MGKQWRKKKAHLNILDIHKMECSATMKDRAVIRIDRVRCPKVFTLVFNRYTMCRLGVGCWDLLRPELAVLCLHFRY